MRFGLSNRGPKVNKTGCDSAMSSAGNIDLLVDNKRINSTKSSIHNKSWNYKRNVTDHLTNNSCLSNETFERHQSLGTTEKSRESNTISLNPDSSLRNSPREEFTYQRQFQHLSHLSSSLIPSPLQTKPIGRSASPCQAGIKHPAPDLQSLQGAHIKTIEHLERTAELLSKQSFTKKTTEDLLDNHLSNSLERLPPRSSSRNQSTLEIHSTMEKTMLNKNNGLLSPPKSPIGITLSHSGCRSGTSPKEISTMDIIGKMFEDFDGTHLDHINSSQSLVQSSGGSNSQRLSSVDRLSVAGSELEPKMLYYPAPVPSILNLPKRLSKRPTSVVYSNRNSQSASTITSNQIRTSWLSVMAKQDMPDYLEKNRKSEDLSNLPPHLSASHFFEHQTSTPEVLELKDDSAVATLDSILDASAHTPVNAFTDNVFARNSMQLSCLEQKQRGSWYLKGPNVKSSERGEESEDQDAISKQIDIEPYSINITSPLDALGDLQLSFEPFEDLKHEQNPQDNEIDEYDETCENEVFHSPPTTLLAELQMRKQRQKQRTQPLTKTFPNGIHSTLLELDTAIQTEQKTRRKGRTILAWEDPAALESQAAIQDDDDVPLGILYPKNVSNNRHLGLLEKRELEDKESLSQRQNRLRDRLALSNLMNSNNNLAANNLAGSKNLLANNNQAARGSKKPHQLPLIDSAKTKNLTGLPLALNSPTPVALPYFEKTAGSLLANHERQAALRSASIQNLKHFSGTTKTQPNPSYNVVGDFNNKGVNQFYHSQQYHGQHSTPKKSAPFYSSQPISGNFAVGNSWGNNMNGLVTSQNNIDPNTYMANMNMNMAVLPPVVQGQMDRVERWRQSITPLVKPSV